MTITDHAGWRVVAAGEPEARSDSPVNPVSRWMRLAYSALLEPGTEPALAEPDPQGRERQPYVLAALDARRQATWFRSVDGEQAIDAGFDDFLGKPLVTGN